MTGEGDPGRKIIEIPADGVRGSTVWGQTEKKPQLGGGGMDIFGNHSLSVVNVLLYKFLIQKGNRR